MVKHQKWMLPVFVSILGFMISVPLAIKNPSYALIATAACLLFVISLVSKIDMPRALAVVLLPTLTAFNMLNTNVGMALTCALICLYAFEYLVNKDYRQTNGAMPIGLLLFAVWFCYAVFQLQWAEHTQRTMSHVITLGFGVVLIWFMSRVFTSFKWIEVLYKVWGGVLLCTLIIGWWEVTTNNHLPYSGVYFYRQLLTTQTVTAGFFNPNDFCFYLIISLPVALHWIKGKMVSKIAGLFMLGSSFYFMYIDGARFIMAVLIAVLCAFLISLPKTRKKLLLFLIVVLFVGVYYNYDLIEKSVADLSSLQTADESVEIRHMLATAALNIFQKHPFGVGPAMLESYMPQVGLGSNVHNFWLEILVNYGILIFLSVALFFVASIIKLFKATRTGDRTLAPILWSAIIFIPACVESSSIFTFNITWFLFGIMICALNIIKRPSA